MTDQPTFVPQSKEQAYSLVFNATDPRSVVNLAPLMISEKIKVIPVTYLDCDEKELSKDCDKLIHLRGIRHGFWEEYKRAAANNTPMYADNICRGICTVDQMMQKYMNTSKKLAYIVRGKMEEDSMMITLNEIAIERLQEFIQMDIHDEKGDVDQKKAGIVFKAMEKVLDRVTPPIHRVEQKTLNVKVDANKQIENDSIKEKIKEMQKRLGMTDESKS